MSLWTWHPLCQYLALTLELSLSISHHGSNILTNHTTSWQWHFVRSNDTGKVTVIWMFSKTGFIICFSWLLVKFVSITPPKELGKRLLLLFYLNLNYLLRFWLKTCPKSQIRFLKCIFQYKNIRSCNMCNEKKKVTRLFLITFENQKLKVS